ncbi:MAG: hypothetical protein AAF892_01595 [Cyanobacteria bacterium P01_D01_bin.71]
MTTLKRWESPRHQGRNHKGHGGAARQRQLRKRHNRLRQRLKSPTENSSPKERSLASLFLCQIGLRQLAHHPNQVDLPVLTSKIALLKDQEMRCQSFT